MITFWLLVAGLVAVVIVALVFVLPPQLRKLRKQPPIITRSRLFKLLGGRAAAIATGIAIPALVVALYFTWPATLFLPALDVPADQPKAAQGEKMAPEHTQVVEDMAARLEQNPNDGRGWAVLAQAYAVMGRYAEAVIAYEKASKLMPNDAQLLVDYADVMAVANDRSLRGKPLDLVRRALKIDSKNVKGLALIGTAAFQAEEYASAARYWERALQLLEPDSPFAQQMKSGIAEARAMATAKPTPAALGSGKTVAGSGQVSGVVTLSPALASKAAPTDSVFVSVKPTTGSPMPLAVLL